MTMADFKSGQTVRIQCEVQPGAFPTELLVTFETAEGPISGFVRREVVKLGKGHQGFIPAIIKEVSRDTVTVMVEGSFFTTTGLAYLKRDWAESNLQPAHAA
jgi:hypothetical protein